MAIFEINGKILDASLNFYKSKLGKNLYFSNKNIRKDLFFENVKLEKNKKDNILNQNFEYKLGIILIGKKKFEDLLINFPEEEKKELTKFKEITLSNKNKKIFVIITYSLKNFTKILMRGFFSYLPKYKDFIHIHSATIINKNKAILFIGPSKSGKSSISYYLKNKGLKVITDEDTYISKRKSLILGLAKFIKLRKGCIFDKNEVLLKSYNSHFIKNNFSNNKLFPLGIVLFLKKTSKPTYIKKISDENILKRMIRMRLKKQNEITKIEILSNFFRNKSYLIYLNWNDTFSMNKIYKFLRNK
jgi:hypothetical protein